jgi:hypothetical protein
MHWSYVCVPILVSSMSPACGGGAKPPRDEGASVEHGASKSEGEASPATASSAATPPAAEPAAEPAPAPAPTKAASGDLVAPTADDPWMAPHQMPAKDVLRTMRAATGRVNACWRAAKKRDGSVSGEVKIKFVITHEGSVRVWRNEDSSVTDEDTIHCVGEVVKSLRFPTQKAPGDAWGIYSINFGG